MDNFDYDLKKVSYTINGVPRYVVHFLAFVNDKDNEKAKDLQNTVKPFKFKTSHLYDIALQKSRQMGGKVYRGKDFGGGIVFQSYNTGADIERIKDIQKQ